MQESTIVEPEIAKAIRRAERIYGSVTVRCDCCGHNWMHKEGNNLRCRFCGGGSTKPVIVGSMIELVG